MTIVADRAIRCGECPGWITRIRPACLVFVLAAAVAWGDVALQQDAEGNYRVEFRYRPKTAASHVTVAGEFNGWDHRKDNLNGPDAQGWWSCVLPLKPGRYEYKFVVNYDQWYPDPGNARVEGGHGNSVIYIGVPAPEKEPEGPATRAPARRPIAAELPKELTELAAGIGKVSSDEATMRLAEWFKTHPMPLFTDDAVSFVLEAPDDSSPQLRLILGTQTELYPMSRLAPGIFAGSIKAKSLFEDPAYEFELQREGKTMSVIDSHAWSVTSRADHPAAAVVRADKSVGRIELWPQVKSADATLPPRDVYIYLPAGYDVQTDRRYPVLYMHDGQNCWDDPVNPFGRGGWNVNRIADRLIKEGKIEPFIGVAVANSVNRMKEYGPGPDLMNGLSQPYLRFLVQELKLAIDKRYRTNPDAAHTAMMGSSLGGAISFQAALTMPDKVGQAACLSPAFVFRDEAGKTYGDLLLAKKKVPARLYIDHGTAGPQQDGAELTRTMLNMIRATGWIDGEDLEYFEDVGAAHDERAWRGRVHRPLIFLFGPRKP